MTIGVYVISGAGRDACRERRQRWDNEANMTADYLPAASSIRPADRAGVLRTTGHRYSPVAGLSPLSALLYVSCTPELSYCKSLAGAPVVTSRVRA